MVFKICLFFTNILFILTKGTSESVVKSRTNELTFGFKDYDKPYFVPLCYREGNDCCESFNEQCLDHKDCNENEICCLANCTVQCYNVKLLGLIPENVLSDINDTIDLELLDTDVDFIRYPTNAVSAKPVNRSDCFPRSDDNCCAVYLKKCHDNSDCEEEDHICCNQNCGTACYPKHKLGKKLFPDGLTPEEFDFSIGYVEEEEEDIEEPVVITANETEDGTLTIVVKNYKP